MYIASLVQAVQTTTDGVEDRSETLVYQHEKGDQPMVSLWSALRFRGTIGIHHLLRLTSPRCTWQEPSFGSGAGQMAKDPLQRNLSKSNPCRRSSYRGPSPWCFFDRRWLKFDWLKRGKSNSTNTTQIKICCLNRIIFIILLSPFS